MTNYSAHLPLSRRGLLVSGASVLLLSGCGMIGPTNPPAQIYVLQPQFGVPTDALSVTWQLGIGVPSASESLDSARIALHLGETMDYFAGAQWTDAVPLLVQAKLIEAFEKSARIPATAATSDALRADYVLETTIRDFEARYDSQDGIPTIVVDLVAKLVATGHNDIVATHDFHQEAPAARNDIPSVVAAFNQAAGAAFKEIVGWTLRAPGAGRVSPVAPATGTSPAHKHKIAS